MLGWPVIRTYVIGAATAAFLGLSGALWLTWSALDASKAENAALERSIAALTMQAKQSALAREVEAARAKSYAARNAELSATIEALLTGDIPDETLDPRIADFINGLRQTD